MVLDSSDRRRQCVLSGLKASLDFTFEEAASQQVPIGKEVDGPTFLTRVVHAPTIWKNYHQLKASIHVSFQHHCLPIYYSPT